MILKYPGSKTRIARKIRDLIPRHVTYCEPYAGSLAVLFTSDGVGVSEIVNDLDGDITNFWRALRDAPATLYDYLRNVPVGRPAHDIVATDHVSRAAATFIRYQLSFGGLGRSVCPATVGRVRRGMNDRVSSWWSAVDLVPVVAERLRRVYIESKPALEVIDSCDRDTTFFYLDPPYLGVGGLYDCEMAEEDHAALLHRLTRCKAKFALSGYRTALYDRAGFRRVDFDVRVSCSKVPKGAKESVYLNF